MSTIKAKFATALAAFAAAAKTAAAFIKSTFTAALDKVASTTESYSFRYVKNFVWMAWAIYTAIGILASSALLLQISIVLGITYIVMSVASSVGTAWYLHTEEKKWEAAMSDLTADFIQDTV